MASPSFMLSGLPWKISIWSSVILNKIFIHLWLYIFHLSLHPISFPPLPKTYPKRNLLFPKYKKFSFLMLASSASIAKCAFCLKIFNSWIFWPFSSNFSLIQEPKLFLFTRLLKRKELINSDKDSWNQTFVIKQKTMKKIFQDPKNIQKYWFSIDKMTFFQLSVMESHMQVSCKMYANLTKQAQKSWIKNNRLTWMMKFG